jgi:type IV fimbrial biogenesis protein FimT
MQSKMGVGGLTLIELLVVVAITAVLSALAAPSMRQFVGNWQLSNAVNVFMGSLQLARSEAIKRGRTARMCRSDNGRTCGSGNNLPGGWTSGWIVFIDNDGLGLNVTAGDQVVFTQGALANFDSIISNAPRPFAYAPTGILKGGVGTQAMTFNWDTDATIQKTICINFTGRPFVARSSTDCG